MDDEVDAISSGDIYFSPVPEPAVFNMVRSQAEPPVIMERFMRFNGPPRLDTPTAIAIFQLMYATMQYHPAFVEWLLEEEAFAYILTEENLHIALYMAVIFGRVELADRLLARGINPHENHCLFCTRLTFEVSNLVDAAVKYDQVESLKVILKHAGSDVTFGEQHMTPLMYATRYNSPKCLEYLSTRKPADDQ